MTNYKNLLHQIKAFAFDVDGVLTDGCLWSMPDGDLLRKHYSRDGYAIRMALEKGYPVAIITGGVSPAVTLRYRNLGVKDIYDGAREKLPCLLDFCQKYHLDPSEVAFAGDDIPDIPPLQACGLPFCPSDACAQVQRVVKYISPFGGGRGCVRDLIEQVMMLHHNWDDPTVISE